jgi:hypothetical protein
LGVQESLHLRDAAGFALDHDAVGIGLLHALAGPTPDTRDPKELVCEVRPVGVGVDQAVQSVQAAVLAVVVLARCSLVQFVLVVRQEGGVLVPLEVAAHPVHEQDIVVVGQSARLEALASAALPDDFVPKVLHAEDGIEDDLQVVAHCWVAVEE